MTPKQKLMQQYSNILQELKSGEVSESKLDAYLLFFSNQLQKTNINESSKDELKAMSESLDMAAFEEAVKLAYNAYRGNQSPDKKVINILKGKDLLKIEGIPKAFVKYIDSLIRLIEPSSLKAAAENSNEINAANERLNSYFKKDYRIANIKTVKPTSIKTDKEILKEIEKGNSLELPTFQLNNFLLALRNMDYLDQSQLNRLRSLLNSGATMEESVKALIPNRTARLEVFQLLKKHQATAKTLDEARKRLY